MRILAADDDELWGEFLRQGLACEGFNVDLAPNGRDAIERAMENPYDAILVDVLMPEMDGYAVVRKMRELKITAAILMVSCLGQERDKLSGFSAGADDYLVKPISLSELVARIHTILHRKGNDKGHQRDPFLLSSGSLSLHLLRREVIRDGRPISVTKTEFILLECFLRRPGQVLSRPVLAQHILSGDFPITTNVIDVHVKNIRDKIDGTSKHSLIRTVRGIGYKLNAQR